MKFLYVVTTNKACLQSREIPKCSFTEQEGLKPSGLGCASSAHEHFACVFSAGDLSVVTRGLCLHRGNSVLSEWGSGGSYIAGFWECEHYQGHLGFAVRKLSEREKARVVLESCRPLSLLCAVFHQRHVPYLNAVSWHQLHRIWLSRVLSSCSCLCWASWRWQHAV